MLEIVSFRGRADRAEWWVSQMATSLLGQLAFLFGFINWQSENPSRHLLACALWLTCLLAAWVSIAWTIKRLRDRGHPAFTILLGLLPVIGWIWLILECGFLPPFDRTPRTRTKLVRRQVAAPSSSESSAS